MKHGSVTFLKASNMPLAGTPTVMFVISCCDDLFSIALRSFLGRLILRVVHRIDDNIHANE